jgi:alkylhydroperoxidase family enzyme
MHAGASAEKVQQVASFRESPLFSERERVALEVAEAMTITGQRVSEDLFTRMRKEFDEAAVVQLVSAVALENFRSKFNVALGVEGQGFCVLPPPAP